MSAEEIKNGHGRREADHILASLLATGVTYAEAAEGAGVSVQTVNRRMASPRFREKVQALRARMVESVTGRLVDSMTAATDKLKTLLDDQDARIQLAAARTILAMGKEFWSGVDVQSMMDKLQDILDRAKGDGIET